MFPFEFTHKVSRYALLSLPLCMLGAGALGAQTVLNATDLTNLRAHIATANAGTGDYTINVAAGTYTLTGLAGDADPASGDLDITRATAGNIRLVGAATASTIIDGAGFDRAFHVNAGAGVTVTFQNMTIRNCRALDDGIAATEARGGGIYIESATDVTLYLIRFENDAAIGANGAAGTNGISSGSNGGDGGNGARALGGGLYVAGGTLTVTACTFSMMFAQGGAGGNGGDGASSGGSNGAYNGGNGGNGGAGADAFGGAIYVVGGTVNLGGSTIELCGALAGVGGVGGNGGDASVFVSLANTGSATGGRGGTGGIGGTGIGGGIYTNGATVNIVNSTLSDLETGEADGGAGGAGGDAAGFGSGSSLLTGGTGGNGGDAGFGLGGGIYVQNGSVNVNNSTVAECVSLSGAAGAGGAGGSPGGSNGSSGSSTTSAGGGAFIDSTGIFVVAGSIFAGSSSDTGEDVYGDLTAGASLFQIAPAGTITPATGANITGQDPLLQPLADNGGPTFTRALGVGSPAIDAGSNPLSLTIDQRGGNYVRVFGPAADMGAFEVQPAGGAGGGGDDGDDDGSCTTSEGISWYSLLGVLAALMLSVRRMFMARRLEP